MNAGVDYALGPDYTHLLVHCPRIVFPTVVGGQLIVDDLEPGERREVTLDGRKIVIERSRDV